MQSTLNPYLNFKNNAREAMSYYHSVFGGELHVQSFKDAGMPVEPSEQDLVMHALLEASNGIRFMASDVPSHMTFDPGARISMALSGENLEELKGYFEKLATGGSVTAPLKEAPWGDTFGMLVDRFGVNWMVNVAAKK